MDKIQIYKNKKRKPADFILIGRDYEEKSENLAASDPEIEKSGPNRPHPKHGSSKNKCR